MVLCCVGHAVRRGRCRLPFQPLGDSWKLQVPGAQQARTLCPGHLSRVLPQRCCHWLRARSSTPTNTIRPKDSTWRASRSVRHRSLLSTIELNNTGCADCRVGCASRCCDHRSRFRLGCSGPGCRALACVAVYRRALPTLAPSALPKRGGRPPFADNTLYSGLTLASSHRILTMA